MCDEKLLSLSSFVDVSFVYKYITFASFGATLFVCHIALSKIPIASHSHSFLFFHLSLVIVSLILLLQNGISFLFACKVLYDSFIDLLRGTRLLPTISIHSLVGRVGIEIPLNVYKAPIDFFRRKNTLKVSFLIICILMKLNPHKR